MTTDQLTGRALDEAAARAMGWRFEMGAWYRGDDTFAGNYLFGGVIPGCLNEREMLAWLHSKAGWGAFLRLESSMVDCPEPWSAERSGDCYVPICHGRDLREALARLVVAVAAREARA